MEDHETVTSDDSSHSQQEEQRHKRRMYLRFAAMIATSTTVMFLLTYTNAFEWDHIRWSEERLYMAILMGSAMALIMLGFMWGMMYKDVRLNVGIMIVAMAVGTTALWLSRSQSFVDDREYMKGMIPHHSIAILTSERSDLDDVRVCDLAVEITEAQRREISEMDWLIDDIEENGPATTKEAAEERQVPDFAGSADRTCP
jgi:cytochrome c oxidase subunit IV